MTADAPGLRAAFADRLELGEGARWVDDRLILVDLLAGRLLASPRPGGDRLEVVLTTPGPLGAVAALADSPGHWVAATGTGIAIASATEPLQWLARPEDSNPVPARMNDGAVDPSGRFWAGSMGVEHEPAAGSLFRVDNDGSVHKVVDGLTVPNGPAFTPDGRTMYLADSARQRIDAFTLDAASGRIVGRDHFTTVTTPGHSPDGMTVDKHGHLWVAIWGGGVVHRYRPDGTLERTVPVPVRQPTSVCLAQGRMFITSATDGMASPGTWDGAVIEVPCDVTGRPQPPAVIR